MDVFITLIVPSLSMKPPVKKLLIPVIMIYISVGLCYLIGDGLYSFRNGTMTFSLYFHRAGIHTVELD